MKPILKLVLAGLMLCSLAGKPLYKEVVLTASDVASAVDIELAIEQATDNGAHPGAVVLDSSEGDFVYTADDRSINIMLPHARLISRNGAVIANCADGVFFDPVPADDILVEGITFHCEASGVTGYEAPHARVRFVNNTIIAAVDGISAGNGLDWEIRNNSIQAKTAVVMDAGARRILVAQNMLQGFIGVLLRGTAQAGVVNNRIQAGWQGVLVGSGADGNLIVANRIVNVEMAGIAFEGDNAKNNVHGNIVTCLAGSDCAAVSADEETLQLNKISGNLLKK